MIWILLLSIFCSCVQNEPKKIDPKIVQPIILVPGLGASALDVILRDSEEPHAWCRHDSKFVRTLFFSFLTVKKVDLDEHRCHNLQVNFNYSSNFTYNNKGIDLEGHDYGGTSGVEYLNPILKDASQVFYTFVKDLVKVGYERGKTIRGAPYDFRRTPQDWIRIGIFDNLKSLVENTYSINNGKKVWLVGHSMGGPFIFSSDWKEKYIAGFVSICGSYDGSFLSIPTMLYGKFYTFPIKINSITREIGGLYWSIPSLFYQDDVFLITEKRNYTSRQLNELFADMGQPELINIFESVKSHDPTPPPGVETHCFRGLGIETPKVSYMKDLSSKIESVETIDGDGQVFPLSESICDGWKDKQKEPVYSYTFDNGFDHRTIIQDPEVIETVYNIIYNK